MLGWGIIDRCELEAIFARSISLRVESCRVVELRVYGVKGNVGGGGELLMGGCHLAKKCIFFQNLSMTSIYLLPVDIYLPRCKVALSLSQCCKTRCLKFQGLKFVAVLLSRKQMQVVALLSTEIYDFKVVFL